MTILARMTHWRRRHDIRPPAPGRCCSNCQHFRNEPDYLEASFPGLNTMGSGYSAVRREDGICALHNRYLGKDSHCSDHQAN